MWRFSHFCIQYGTSITWSVPTDGALRTFGSSIGAAYSLCLLFGVLSRGMTHSSIVCLTGKSELAVSTVMYFLSTADQGALTSQALGTGRGSVFSDLVPSSATLPQLIDGIYFISIVHASSFDQVISYVA